MSDVLDAFWKRATWDPVIQARLKTIRSDSTEEAIADLVRIGKEFGFPFSAEDYRRSLPAPTAEPLPAAEPGKTGPPEVPKETRPSVLSSGGRSLLVVSSSGQIRSVVPLSTSDAPLREREQKPDRDPLPASDAPLRAQELDRDPRGVAPEESREASTCCSHTDADY